MRSGSGDIRALYPSRSRLYNSTPVRSVGPDTGKQFSIGRRQKTWRVTFAEDLQIMGVTWRGAELLAIARDGGILSFDVSTGTGGAKSKSKQLF